MIVQFNCLIYMGRIKYDIWVKPVCEDSSIYKIRFTNEDAMNHIKNIGISKGVYRSGIVIFRLNEWHTIPAEIFNYIQYSCCLNVPNIKIEYSKVSHFEHGFTVA